MMLNQKKKSKTYISGQTSSPAAATRGGSFELLVLEFAQKGQLYPSAVHSVAHFGWIPHEGTFVSPRTNWVGVIAIETGYYIPVSVLEMVIALPILEGFHVKDFFSLLA